MLRRLVKFAIVACAVLTCGVLILFAGFWGATPDPSALRTADPQTTSFIQQRCGAMDANTSSDCFPRWTPLSRMSPFLPQAVVLAEDIRFFRHGGLDFQSLWAALKVNWRSGKAVWGGSTITQQLAKNLYLSREKTLGRKLREIALTVKLERSLPKERILEIYLNVAQWGPNLFGIANASEHFFGKTPAELGPLEASYLASILPNPEHADEPAWKSKFTDVGARIFDALLQSYLPPVRMLPQSGIDCPEALEADEITQTDYVVAKIFGAYSNDILSGRAALLSFGDLSAALSEDENAFVKGLWERSRATRPMHALSCRREDNPPESDFTPILQPSNLYGRRSYFLPKSAAARVTALLDASTAAKRPLVVTSAYRGGGYQTYLFLATLRQNGYCLSQTSGEVALPEESEHACLDTPAVDLGALGEEPGPFENSKAFSWLETNAASYGFTMSYPENNAQGILYEPWHWKWSERN